MLRKAIALAGLAAVMGSCAPAAVAAEAGGGDSISRVEGRLAWDLIPVSRVRALRIVIRSDYVRGDLNRDGPPFFVHGSGAMHLAALVNRIRPLQAGDDPICPSHAASPHARVGLRVTVRFLGAGGQRLARARLHEHRCDAFIRLRVHGRQGSVLEVGTPGETLETALRRLGVPRL